MTDTTNVSTSDTTTTTNATTTSTTSDSSNIATSNDTLPIKWEWRLVIGVLALIFNGTVIWWCLLYGKSENLLHQNALSWAYISGTLILAGLGFNSALPIIMPYFTNKRVN